MLQKDKHVDIGTYETYWRHKFMDMVSTTNLNRAFGYCYPYANAIAGPTDFGPGGTAYSNATHG